MDLSIIIVNYKTISLIKNCIDSILKFTTEIQYEIIIVDNNSNDDCKKILSNIYGNKIKVIEIKKNIGFGRANNVGLMSATGNAVLFLNPDTVLLNNALEILYAFLFSDSLVGAVGGNLYDESLAGTNSFIRYFPGVHSEFRKILYLLSGRTLFSKNEDFNTTDKPIKVSSITGADLMVKREILIALGGFDRDYFMYLEETDLCKRICDIGYDIYSVPCAKIQHLEGKSFNNAGEIVNKRKYVLNEEGRRLFAKKHINSIYLILYNFLYLIRLLILNILKPNLTRRFILSLYFKNNKNLNNIKHTI